MKLPNLNVPLMAIGKVLKRNPTKPNVVSVRVLRMELDARLMKHFTEESTFWALEENNLACQSGDIVLMKKLTEPPRSYIPYQVSEMEFRVGNIVDPITGRRCRGTQFIDEVQRKQEQQNS